MGGDSGYSNGQGNGSPDIRTALVGGAEDGEDQDKCGHDFNAESLSLGQLGVDLAHAHAEAQGFGGDTLC